MTPTLTPERKCCEKCWKNTPHPEECESCRGEGSYPAKCENPSCPCHTPESRLREEWEKFVQTICGEKFIPTKVFADWWLSKFSQDRERLVGEILTAIRGMKIPDYNKDEAHNLGFEVAKQNAEWIVEDLLKSKN